ncbi:hypothetical protein OH77DRAFT_1420876 [Trametes cingulata]|nr:hypothetical protein OH77DRAFT_1420876 [Trametes cingulata]
MASAATMMDGRDLRRTRSESAAPWVDGPRGAPRVRAYQHRPGESISRTAPTLPPLDLPGELRMPSAGGEPVPVRWSVPLYRETERAPPPQQEEYRPDTDNHEQPDGLFGMILELLGFAGANAKARRELMSLIFTLAFGFAQFVIIITLLAYSAHHESPTVPGENEWRACEKPLGVWNALWLVRTALGCLLAVGTWKRERAARLRRVRRRSDSDAEIATQRYLNGQPHYPRATDGGPTMASGRQPTRATGLSYEGTSGNSNAESSNRVPQSRLHARVSMLTSAISLVWFLAAHVLEYTSVNTCRFSAPHLWWLTFGIMCILYLMILEIFLLGLLVFILGPVLYLVWNIFLLCLGRHPLQNPHYIKPDIGKLPKAIVQQIPLVLYIPTPPGESTDDSTPITVPPAAHAYPPKGSSGADSSAPAAAQPKRRFAFFRRKGASKNKSRSSPPREGGSAEKGAGKQGGAAGSAEEDLDEDVPWDEMWEKGEYPFVRLEGNRAVCAICLMDFEEPRRVRGPGAGAAGKDKDGNERKAQEKSLSATPAEVQGSAATQEVQVEEVTEEERDALKLNDAGEGPQPLRLLSCGHAFHQTCVDPWLTDVSGRCPTCQRPVEIPEPSKKAKRRRRRRTEPA